MAAAIIDGKILAAQVKQQAAREVAELKAKGVAPGLTVFLVGENPASAVYVRGKAKDCEECGIESAVVRLPETAPEAELLAQIQAANQNPAVHGILVQLPLPAHIDEKKVIEAISPAKDVDGFTPVNVGRLQIGEEAFAPCTPAGCLYMLQAAGVALAGKDAVVLGRSNIVGKPMALLLLAASATVTVCHTKTRNMAQKCAAADIIVAAAGRPGLVTAEMVKPGAVVIDVGMNRGANGKLCGDVDFEAVSRVAGAITPVPGGVGLMTRAMLMKNTVKAARLLAGL
ncbi:MAG: bifunctional methylenetetrahydrofolate dehydrogenase/methenyltetrahydrofolate cyclohydrolase FolD [Oscillospiraceae bacterium]